ncbi:MAG: hypothetical protein LBP22_02035 [Deltaproteobacteria bacterium]|jgi:hypothetical protein|nr:hypothetical protein [Deltaproteobacteria bacterium]
MINNTNKKPICREAMVGVILRIYKDGNRRSAIYLGEAPEWERNIFGPP